MTGHLSKIISFFVCIALSFSAIQAQSKGGVSLGIYTAPFWT